MPPISGLVHWHHYVARNLKTIRTALTKAARLVDASLGGQPQAKLEPVLARNAPKQPLHPLARIRQSQSRWYSTAKSAVNSSTRQFTTTASGRAGPKYDRASFPKSRVSAQINQSSGRAPFAHTLRPNLTGGTLGRTAGGYTLGSGRVGGARYFSHTPAAQAQVVNNVSQAVRAFFVGGQKAQFDGMSPRGEKRYKAVTALQDETGRKMRSIPRASPGSYVDFRINPTVTAITPMTAVTGFTESEASPLDHLNTDGLLDVLSVDFSRALKDLAAIMNDFRRLSALGDLPITYEGSNLRIHFPGCDADTVERLCEELGVSRGVVHQDAAFDAFTGTEIALLFPFAPSQAASNTDTPAYSTQSARSDSDLEDAVLMNPRLSTSSEYESVRSGTDSSGYASDRHSPLEYQGFEGIYRFIEELDAVRK
ncbi:hypothetical protein BAUCODRAFT_62015 [Baudoinia panamericana UAMH 10762]|uniref:Casein kinase II beta 2 subunit n=1 Tax=Baudoinia panamericana (strain UAMH 10762) TaxID=717646 RepID=M2NAD8_BAUPA|nr:uncharacterized protein BAUCODRAFT_62015 [Baudoinia panamericana UAMH 10762]EMD01189.1 hypothetical protein BAUCODRAFT_62015 [Baudoinia panamericana UAMH 10762]